MAYTKRSDAELLQAALAGYQHQYEVLGERIAEITRQLGGRTGRLDLGGATGGRPKRVMSAETRRRMAESQQKRWAGVKAAGGSRKKRNMSAEGRERIAEATRKRWAEYRAQKAQER